MCVGGGGGGEQEKQAYKMDTVGQRRQQSTEKMHMASQWFLVIIAASKS